MSNIVFEVFLVLYFFILLAITYFTLTLLSCVKQIQVTTNYIAGLDVAPDAEQDEIQLEIEKRDKEFAERIDKIKSELASGAASIAAGAYVGTVAEELHPNVHNLPHNTVREEFEPDVEYSV